METSSDTPRFSVALTGGVASGKSEVALAFAALGVAVVDADVIAREVVAPGSPALAEIVAAFGVSVLDASGALDRRLMRDRVFRDAGARATINAITHPRIARVMQDRAVVVETDYVMLVIPLLVESRRYAWVDRVLVVDAGRDVQLARLLQRDGIDPSLASAMLDAQASRERRLAIADDVITNEGSLDSLRMQVTKRHEDYLVRARTKALSAPTHFERP